MLKFQRNRTKLELINLEFCLWPHLTLLTHAHNTNQRFGKKNPELLPESLKFNGNTFVKLFLGDLDEKISPAGYKREWNK